MYKTKNMKTQRIYDKACELECLNSCGWVIDAYGYSQYRGLNFDFKL